MSVSDRWHKTRPRPGDPVCEHDMAPTAVHGRGDRWQVRWRDDDGRQLKRNFARKTGKDPERHADAFDARIQAGLDDDSYTDPAAGNVKFRAYAEDWRKTRTHDIGTADRIERELRLHAYPVLGDRTLRELSKRPSIMQAWIAGLPLAPASAGKVVGDVSAALSAAVDDGIITRNPLAVRSVRRPSPVRRKAVPWTLARVGSVAAALPARWQVLPYLGAGTGMRQGEMFGLALEDVDFLRRVVHVRVQVRLVGDKLSFGPVKNRKEHDVPLAGSLVPVLSEHIRKYPPRPVTLPWITQGGNAVTRTLILTTTAGGAVRRTRFNESWDSALVQAGIRPAGKQARDRRPEPGNGCHVLRHTAASAWLSAGVSVAAVADWLGDTPQVVLATYAHLMPADVDAARKAVDAFFTASAPDVPSAGEM